MYSSRHAKTSKILLASALAVLLASCASGPKIRADADPTANFASYKTFGFFDQLATDKSKYSTMLTTRLKDAVRREMKARGLEESAQPQLLVNFNTNVENRTEVQSTPSAGVGFYGYRGGMYGAWGGYPQDVHTTNYQEGTLAIDVVDAAKKQLVWQGIAQARLTKTMVENPGETIDSVVTEIFAKYPVAPAPAPGST